MTAAPIAGYPLQWEANVLLADGGVAHLRPSGPRLAARVPVDMSDGVPNPVTFRRWDGTVELAVDRAIQDTRSVIYPLHGLDAYDPRD